LYTDPADPAAQIQELATDIDTDMDALWDRMIAGYNQPACRVRSSGINQAIAVSTDVTATYAEELYDNQGMVNLGVSNTNINIVETGLYLATARVTFLSNGNATINARQVTISTTGSLGIVGRRAVEGEQNNATAVQISSLFWIASGGVVTVVQRQNSGASVNSSTRTLMVARMGGL
jgi:hypothetical protein